MASCTGDGPILTDSGGFQVFSLEALRKITEEGVQLPLAHRRQRRCGSRPKIRWMRSSRWARTSRWRSMTARRIRPPNSRRATRWSARCAGPRAATLTTTANATPPGELFGIVQGGMHLPLRLTRRSRRSQTASVEGLRGRRARGRASPRRTGCACSKALLPHMPGGQAALSHGRRHGRRTSSPPSRAASTCSTACMPTRHARNGHLFTLTGRA